MREGYVTRISPGDCREGQCKPWVKRGADVLPFLELMLLAPTETKTNEKKWIFEPEKNGADLADLEGGGCDGDGDEDDGGGGVEVDQEENE